MCCRSYIICLMILLLVIYSSPAEWKGTITATVTGADPKQLTFGVDSEATDGFDPGIDNPLAPMPPMPQVALDVAFIIDDLFFPRLSVDIKREGVANQWQLEVRSDIGDIELTWDISGVPSDVSTMLLKTATGTVNMRLESSLSLALGQYSLLLESWFIGQPGKPMHIDTPMIEFGDDTVLESYWGAPKGNVDHYDVYLSIDGGDYFLAGRTPTAVAPTREDPYPVPIVAEDGRRYQIKVQAVAADGTTGPMSEPSNPAWCMMPRPGYVKGQTPGDANGDGRVGVQDLVMLGKALGRQRGEAFFDYRGDLNYDGIVNIRDLVIVGRNWGRVY